MSDFSKRVRKALSKQQSLRQERKNMPVEYKQQCYNCGVDLTKETATREHIPAKCLFEGFADTHKVNRLTVPACRECNNKCSDADEEFRNMIGILSKNPANDGITQKAIKSIERKYLSAPEKFFINSMNRPIPVEIDRDKIEAFNKKNFKGLFYYKYGFPLPANYELLVHIDETDWSNSLLQIIGYLVNNFNWKHSGHEDIFKYIIQPFCEGWRGGVNKDDIIIQQDEHYFMAAMLYNQIYGAMVFAVKKDELEAAKKKRIRREANKWI